MSEAPIEKLATVLPVDDLKAAVAAWTRTLGKEPTFVDGDRWAQFDVGGGRLALAGTDRTSDRPGLMLKVADVEARREAFARDGFAPGPLQQGPHELRFEVQLPGGVAIFYQPR
jgi:hypothetical protein